MLHQPGFVFGCICSHIIECGINLRQYGRHVIKYTYVVNIIVRQTFASALP